MINKRTTKDQTSINQQVVGGLRTQGIFKTSSQKNPLITVITVVYNGQDYLEQTIKSVTGQSYKNIEYLIIDGNSNDQTLSIIKKYENEIDYYVSEYDNGIYHAMNKGIIQARGNYIHILNAGDYYISRDSIEELSQLIIKESPKFVASIVKYILESGVVKKLNMTGDVDTICHPGLIVRSDIYKKNLFNEGIKYASDIEFFLRVIKKDEVLINNKVFAGMPAGGLGSNAKCMRETFSIYLKYKKFHRAAYVLAKLARKKIKDLLSL